MLKITPLPLGLIDQITERQKAKEATCDAAVVDHHSDKLSELRAELADYLDGVGIDAEAFYRGVA